eukprot:SAG11_NODE_11641_length_747_cov_1.040123_2_plen_36_part_01
MQVINGYCAASDVPRAAKALAAMGKQKPPVIPSASL